MNFRTEHPLRITHAAELLGVSAETVRRWTTHGSRGVILESAKVGGSRITTREAIERFAGIDQVAVGGPRRDAGKSAATMERLRSRHG